MSYNSHMDDEREIKPAEPKPDIRFENYRQLSAEVREELAAGGFKVTIPCVKEPAST